MGRSTKTGGGGGVGVGGGQPSNGGILGSGIFGMFGSTVTCKSEDDSTYCQIIKAFNLLLIAFFIFSVLYLIYHFFTMWKSGRKSGNTMSLFGGKKQ
jgi:hypothetical protein